MIAFPRKDQFALSGDPWSWCHSRTAARGRYVDGGNCRRTRPDRRMQVCL